MINDDSIHVAAQGEFAEGFLKPQYDSYCFSKIPSTLLKLLGCGEGGLPRSCVRHGVYNHVIIILIDGFGWRFLEKYKDRYPFLQRFYAEGIVSKLTSQFPSTTAAHLTTLASNMPVGEHGIYEWFLYEPEVQRVVAPLLYTFAGDKKSLEPALAPEKLLPKGLFFKELQEHKMGCRVFQQESISDSVYSRWMFGGAERVGYKKWADVLQAVTENSHTRGLSYLYFGDFDTQAHRHGIDSPEVEKALEMCFNELENWLASGDLPKSTALIVTADHGMIEISPKTTIYLNERFPDLESKLKKGADGHVLAPAGSCRDFFLHVEPSHIMNVYKELKDELKDVAWVCLTAELIMRGFFGSKGISERCRSRMADLCIIAKGTNSIWWNEPGRFEQKLFAMHGGLTREEMETIFLFLSF